MRRRVMMFVPLAIAASKLLTEERRATIRRSMEKVPERLPDRVGPVVIREQKRSKRRAGFLVGLGAVAGGLIAYFFDPDRGRGRRAKAKDMTAARLRRTREKARGAQMRAENKMEGIRHDLRPRELQTEMPNDPTLQHKVESEVLRDFPKGRINVNAEEGVVVLRGTLDTPEEIRELEARVRGVPGVFDVENLTHVKGTEARR